MDRMDEKSTSTSLYCACLYLEFLSPCATLCDFQLTGQKLMLLADDCKQTSQAWGKVCVYTLPSPYPTCGITLDMLLLIVNKET